MTERELGWVSGLFEGEGAVVSVRSQWRRKDGVRAWASPRLTLGTTDEEVARQLHRLAGGRLNGPYRPMGLGSKPFWQWILARWEDVGEFVTTVGPYLSARRQEQIVNAYWNYHMTRKWRG